MNNNSILSFTHERLSPALIDYLCIPEGYEHLINKVTLIDGKYYLYKRIGHFFMINELIGSYLARYINLRAVDYQIGESNLGLHALSELFYKPDYYYTTCYDHYRRTALKDYYFIQKFFLMFYHADTSILDRIKSDKMLFSVLKLIALDLKMGQIDRHNNNVMLEINKSNNEVDLAPIYDFSLSYCDTSRLPYFYDSPFIGLRRNKASLDALVRKYPEVLKYIELLINIPIEYVLKEISREKGLIISDKELEYYLRKDEGYTRLLSKAF